LDILLNEFVANSGEFPQLEDVPGITKREIPLGGYWYDEQDVGDLAIKYHYGYQYDKYGKAALLQGFGTLNKFYKEMADDIIQIINDDQYTGMGWLYNNFDTNEEVLNIPYKTIEYKDGYKVILDINDFSKYKNNNKNIKELRDELLDDLKPWFEGVEIDGNKIIIPICSNPLEKEDEVQS
jgi:hypothetical protein